MRVFVFGPFGRCVRCYSTILSQGADVAQSFESRKPESLRVVAIDKNGSVDSFSTSRVEVSNMLSFPLRDLRCLTKSFDISQVLLRREAIVLNLKYVRAVLTAERVMLIDEFAVNDELVKEVRNRIRSPFPTRKQPFELLAMEGMLHYMWENLQKDLDRIEPAVQSLLSSLEAGDPSEMQLRSLLNFSKQLGSFGNDIQELKESIDRLLLSPEDMRAIYLTDTKNGILDGPHEEVEILLENYTRRLEETANAVSELQGYISATEAYLKIRYDGQRNKIMRQTLVLTFATFSMGTGTMVSSLFGMNLLSQMENHPNMFYYVAGGTTTTSALIFTTLFMIYRRRPK